MMLNFPNLSRSYDGKRGRIRFWGHDASLEVPFFLDASALHALNPTTGLDEAGLLQTFDLNRDAIQRAAARIYTRNRCEAYTLIAADFA